MSPQSAPVPPDHHPTPGAGAAGPGTPGAARNEVPSHLSWPVGAVAERVGLAASTLRSWDRRYGIGPSDRTSGNHRRYSHIDVLRVLSMVRLTAQGVPALAASAATLALTDDDLVREVPGVSTDTDRLATGDATTVAHRVDRTQGEPIDGLDPASVPATVRAIVGAARVLDSATLSHLFRQTLRQPDIAQGWETVIAPSLRLIGSLWEQGQLGVDSEHLASELLGSELRAVTRSNTLRVAYPPVLLATADDEQHHLPVLALEAELSRHGVACTFLGPRMPSEATARAIERTGAERVFLWASIPRGMNAPVLTLRPDHPPVRVVLGGPGWPHDPAAHAGPVEVVRASSFRGALEALLPG